MRQGAKRLFSEVYTLNSKDQALLSAHRLTIFADGILAIAATLLVLDLKVEIDGKSHGLWSQIHHQLPQLFSILLGFLWIAGSWVLSHRQVRQLKGVNHYMALYILASTLTITLIPFATKLLAAGYGHSDFWIGVEAVNAVILVSTLLSVASARYAHRHDLMLVSTPPRKKGQPRPIALVIWYVVVFLSFVAVLLAPFAPWVAFGIIVLTRLSALMPLRSDRVGAPGTE